MDANSDMARRLERLRLMHEQQQQQEPQQSSSSADAAAANTSRSALMMARKRLGSVKYSAPPTRPPLAPSGAALLSPSPQAPVTASAPLPLPSEAKESPETLPIIIDTNGSTLLETSDPPPDENEPALFELSVKHCGAHVISRYNAAVHFFVAGVVDDDDGGGTAGAENEGTIATAGDGSVVKKKKKKRSVVIIDESSPQPAATAPGESEAVAAVRMETEAAAAITESNTARSTGTVRKRRVVFCLAESSNVLQSAEERISASQKMTTVKTLHMICSPREFRNVFLPFFNPELEVPEKKKRKPVEGEAEENVPVDETADQKIARLVREMTRSTAVPYMPLFFPNFDQSALQPTTSNSGSGKGSRTDEGEERLAKCFDHERCVWCPVLRLKQVKLQDEDTPLLVIEPLRRLLKEDAAYICQVHSNSLKEITQAFQNKLHNMHTKHEVLTSQLRDEVRMLQQEILWAEEELGALRAVQDRKRREMEIDLLAHHVELESLQPRSRLQRSIPEEREVQKGEGAYSPVRKFQWRNVEQDLQQGQQHIFSVPASQPLVQLSDLFGSNRLLREMTPGGKGVREDSITRVGGDDLCASSATVGVRPSRSQQRGR